MSICDGIPEIIQAHTAGPHPDIGALLDAMLARVEANWAASPNRLTGKRPSAQNWRFESVLYIAPHNQSPEKTLEKAIARLLQHDGWVNQVPTASGLFQGQSDKLRNVDLVCRIAPFVYEFIELKVKSNTPFSAAMEVLQYAVLYTFARRHYTEAERVRHELLNAKMLYLRVLAPRVYYRNTTVAVLAAQINAGLVAFSKRQGLAWGMDFAFLAFPADFVWPCSDEELRSGMQRIHGILNDEN